MDMIVNKWSILFAIYDWYNQSDSINWNES